MLNCEKCKKCKGAITCKYEKKYNIYFHDKNML